MEKCVWHFCYFNFERKYDVLKSKHPWLFFKGKRKKETLIKTKQNREWKISLTLLKRRSINNKNREFEANEKKGVQFFCFFFVFFVFFFSNKISMQLYLFYFNV